MSHAGQYNRSVLRTSALKSRITLFSALQNTCVCRCWGRCFPAHRRKFHETAMRWLSTGSMWTTKDSRSGGWKTFAPFSACVRRRSMKLPGSHCTRRPGSRPWQPPVRDVPAPGRNPVAYLCPTKRRLSRKERCAAVYIAGRRALLSDLRLSYNERLRRLPAQPSRNRVVIPS